MWCDIVIYIYLSRFTWYNIQIFTCTSWCIYNILIILNYGDGIVMVLPCIYTNVYYMPFIFNIIIHFTFFCVSSIPTLFTCLEYRFLMLSYKNIYLWYTKYVLIGTPLFWGGNHPSYLKHLQYSPYIISTGMGGVVLRHNSAAFCLGSAVIWDYTIWLLRPSLIKL